MSTKTLNESEIVKTCLFSGAVEKWLMADPNGKWFKHDNNPNCFTDQRLGRVLYVYEEYVKFWDDTRIISDYRVYPLPNNKLALLDIINNH